MRYDLEEQSKIELYKRFEQENFKKGMTNEEFQNYISELIRYVEQNFRQRYQDLVENKN